MTAHVVDITGVAVALLVPIALVWRFRWWGVLFGALVQWATLIACGTLLNALDPERDAAMLDAIWLLLGLPFALAFCALVHLGFTLLRRVRGRSPGSAESLPVKETR
jgi:hypothetical protein